MSEFKIYYSMAAFFLIITNISQYTEPLWQMCYHEKQYTHFYRPTSHPPYHEGGPQ